MPDVASKRICCNHGIVGKATVVVRRKNFFITTYAHSLSTSKYSWREIQIDEIKLKKKKTVILGNAQNPTEIASYLVVDSAKAEHQVGRRRAQCQRPHHHAKCKPPPYPPTQALCIVQNMLALSVAQHTPAR